LPVLLLLLLLLLLCLQESTVQGYLAEAAAAYGCSLQQAQALQAAAGLSGDAAAEVLLWRLVAAMHSNRSAPLSALKSSLPPDVTYGQIKVGAGAILLSLPRPFVLIAVVSRNRLPLHDAVLVPADVSTPQSG
jgi:hypothetical protein